MGRIKKKIIIIFSLISKKKLTDLIMILLSSLSCFYILPILPRSDPAYPVFLSILLILVFVNPAYLVSI
jgi:hypothetical protein